MSVSLLGKRALDTYEGREALSVATGDDLTKYVKEASPAAAYADTTPSLERRVTIEKTQDKRGEDSDEDFDGISASKSLMVFARKGSIPAIATTIPCQDRNIKGSELIQIVHDIVWHKYWEEVEFASICEYNFEGIGEVPLDEPLGCPPKVDNRVLWIQHPSDWFMSLGGWKGMMPNREVRKYFFFEGEDSHHKFTGVRIYAGDVIFPIKDHRIFWPERCSVGFWAAHPSMARDLSYPEIVEVIKSIKNTFELNDAKIATLQLSAISYKMRMPDWFQEGISETGKRQILRFLNYLNSLMFGVEASGLNSALITSLMTLDLIARGRFTYSVAFNANDDGGVYPYACFGDNKGTYKAREELLADYKGNRTEPYQCLRSISMGQFRDTPALSPVAIKEASLIKEWLVSNGVISGGISHSDQMEKVKRAIEDLMVCYFEPMNQALK